MFTSATGCHGYRVPRLPGATAQSRGTNNSQIKEYYLYHHNQFGDTNLHKMFSYLIQVTLL